MSSNTQKDTSQKSNISIFPEYGTFRDIIVGNTYVQQFTVLNLFHKSISIRVNKPQTTHFGLSKYRPHKNLAPGLEMKFCVEFYATEEKDYHDVVSIITDDEIVSIPLNAYLPRSEIIAPSTFDLGNVRPNTTTSKFFTYQNFGSLSGTFCFEIPDQAPIRIIPKEGVILPKHEQEVKVQYKSGENTGVMQHSITLLLDNKQKRKIEVIINVLEQKIFLCHPQKRKFPQKKSGKKKFSNTMSSTGGGTISILKFPLIHYGEYSTRKMILTNSSAFDSSFSLKKKVFSPNMDDDDIIQCSFCGHSHSKKDECDFGSGKLSKPVETRFRMTPMDGTIKKFSSVEIEVKFWPKKSDRSSSSSYHSKDSREAKNRYGGLLSGSKGNRRSRSRERRVFEEDWKVILSEKSFIDFTLFGTAIYPNVNVTNKKILFNECPVYDYRDVLVEIENSNELPINYNFVSVAHFEAKPKSGTLQAYTKKNVTISFHPNQLGVFANNIKCVFGTKTSLKVINIYVSGKSSSIGVKGRTIGGVNMIKTDFIKDRKYITNVSLLDKGEMELTKYKKRIKNYDNNANQTISLYHLNELREKKKNEDKYNNYLTQFRERKEYKKRTRKIKSLNMNFMNDVDLGMIPSSGLLEPIPVLKIKECKLFTNVGDYTIGKLSGGVVGSSGSGAGGKEKGLKVIKDSDGKVIKRIFKEYPTTQNELRETKILLSKKQLNKIIIFPRTLKFGEITVYGKGTKTFSIRNELSQCIFIEIATKMSEISIVPRSQVIPAMSTGNFDVILYATEAQLIQQNVFFRVNEHNKLKMSILAEVNPAEISMSKDEIKFRFNDYTLDPYIDEIISLTNKGNALSTFEFVEMERNTHEKNLFQIKPRTATIEPQQTKQIHIIFNPNKTIKITKEFLLKVKGSSSDKILKCIADLKEAKMKVVEKKINFGIFPVGMKIMQYLTLKNVGEEPAVFHIKSQENDLKCIPMKGRINKKSNQKILLELKPSEASIYKSNLIIKVRAGKTIKIPISGESRTPSVEIIDTPSKLDYGTLFIGSKRQHTIKIKNVGSTIPAILFLDLTENTQFLISDENDQVVTLEDNGKNITAVPVFDEEMDYSDDEMDLNEQQQLSGQNDGRGIVHDDEILDDVAPETQTGLKYKLMVKPNEILVFNLIYKPAVAEKQEFKLKLYLAGLESNLIGRNVIGNALKPKLVMSQSLIDFRTKVVMKDSSMPHRIVVNFSNEDKQDLEFSIGHRKSELEKHYSSGRSSHRSNGNIFSSGSEGIFKIDPQSGRLQRGESCQVQVFFLPTELRKYEYKIPIFIITKDYDDKDPYCYLTVKGRGSFPNLSFDKDELILPIVPLGIPSYAKFFIINDGYNKIDLKYFLSNDTEKIPLKLNFPEGKVIDRDKVQLPVEVSFVSKKPMSFCSKITFFDNDGRPFSIKVSCISDNCILTNFPYIYMNRDNYRIVSNDIKKAITLQLIEEDIDRKGLYEDDDDDDGRLSYPGSVFSTMTTVLSSTANILRSIYSRRSSRRLLNWLNATIMENPVDDLFRALKQSNGGLLFDIIFVLTGKKVLEKNKKKKFGNRSRRSNNIKNGKKSGSGSGGKKDRSGSGSNLNKVDEGEMKLENAITQYENFKKLILFLKQHGALLSHVREYFFITYENFKILIENGILEEDFPAIGSGGKSDKSGASSSRMKKKKSFGGGRTSGNRSTVGGPKNEGRKKRISEPTFKHKAIEAWATVLYQIIKLFVLQRITPKRMKESNPFVPKELVVVDKTLTGSNFMSLHEMVILRWLTYHVKKQYPKYLNEGERIGGFGSELADSVAFSAVLLSHIESLHPLLLGIRAVKRKESRQRMVNNTNNNTNNTSNIKKRDKSKDKSKDDDDDINDVNFQTIQEEFTGNANKIIAALREAKIQYVISSNDIISGNPRDLLLFSLFLFNVLPQYLPRTKVVFEGNLHEEIVKLIDLKNPTKHTIEYNVTQHSLMSSLSSPSHSGQSNIVRRRRNTFIITSDHVVLPAKSKVSFPIKLIPKFISSSSEKITFFPKKTGSYRPDVLVFLLETRILSAGVQKEFKIKCNIFEHKTVEIPVHNMFDKTGTFKIRIEQSSKNGREGKFYSKPFWLTKDSIKIKNDGNKILVLNFLPCESTPVMYYCKLYFSDPNVGEFIYGIKGSCYPYSVVTQRYSYNAVLGQALKKEIVLLQSNPDVEKAIMILTERNKKYSKIFGSYDEKKDLENDAMKKDGGSSGGSKKDVESILNYGKNKRRRSGKKGGKKRTTGVGLGADKKRTSELIEIRVVKFDTKFSNSKNFSCSKHFTFDVKRGFPFQFNTKSAGVFKATLSFTSELDQRLIEINVTARPPGIKAELHFGPVPVRKKIVQRIPISNKSQVAWVIQMYLKGEFWSGPTELHVPVGKTVNYPLTFFPLVRRKKKKKSDDESKESDTKTSNVTTVSGELTIHNPTTMEKYIFSLTGEIIDPIAEKKIFIECKARERMVYALPVKNISIAKFLLNPNNKELSNSNTNNQNLTGESLYNVSCDLDFIKFSPTFSMKDRVNEEHFELKIVPNYGGVHTGSIKFESTHENGGNGELIWYVLEINVIRSSPEMNLNCKSVLRRKKVIPIEVVNPLKDKDVNYSVVMEGPGVSGPSFLSVKAGKAKVYNLIYKPTLVEQNVSGSISFFDEIAGEFWYTLNLTCVEPLPIELETVSCEIGKEKKILIPVRLPDSVIQEREEAKRLLVKNLTVKNLNIDEGSAKKSEKESGGGDDDDDILHLQITSSNTRNFIVQKSLKLNALEPSNLSVTYVPSSINTKETCLITIKHNEIGKYIYKLTGMGIKPLEMETIKILSQQGRLVSSLVMFRNPLPKKIKIKITMKQSKKNKKEKIFALLSKGMKKSDSSLFYNDENDSNRSGMRSRDGKKEHLFISLKPFQITNIPFSFMPLKIDKYNCRIVVSVVNRNYIAKSSKRSGSTNSTSTTNTPTTTTTTTTNTTTTTSKRDIGSKERDKGIIEWVYPILGITEVINEDVEFEMKCKSRTKMRKQIIVPLKGLKRGMFYSGRRDKRSNSKGYNDFQFNYKIEFPKQNFLKAIRRSFRIKRKGGVLIRRNREEDDEYSLSFVIDFAPLRPFDGNVDLIIQEKNGGIWKFVVKVVATPPEVDDSIEILSVIGKMKRVSFRLSNIFSYNSKFESYFTPESSLNFLATPETGILPPKGYEGTQFIVSFQADSYGKLSKACLIIDTKEMQWRYNVKAVLPKLKKLEKKSKIDNKLSLEVRNNLKKKKPKKSFLEDNREMIKTMASQKKRAGGRNKMKKKPPW